jgi:ABC-2 type transport system ATP-binding protein
MQQLSGVADESARLRTPAGGAGIVLAVANVEKCYGSVRAVQGVSFTVRAGEVVGILGPNGAGKTTTLSMICGLLRPDAGSISVAGIDVVAQPQRARTQIGFAAQQLGIYPTLTVHENLSFFGQVGGLSRSAAEARSAELLTLFDLGADAARPAGELSGGTQRRVHVACGLAGRPKLALLDEPTVGMDLLGRERALKTIASIAAHGTAVCFSSHYMAEVEAICHRVVIVDHGRVVAEGAPAELITRHGQPYVEIHFEDGRSVVQHVTDLAQEPARLMAAAASEGALASVEIVRPSLDAVFLSLCGRRVDAAKEES